MLTEPNLHYTQADVDALLKRATELVTEVEQLTGERDQYMELLADVRAERDRYRAHSVTLNTVAFAMALALGDVAPGANETEGDPIEQTRRLINVYSPNWLGRANTASALAHLDAHAAEAPQTSPDVTAAP